MPHQAIAVEASLLSKNRAQSHNHVLHSEFGSDSTKHHSTAPKNEIPQAKNQEKRPKRKRHVPKVYDKTKKPKKKLETSKPMNPSTPKPRTPKRPKNTGGKSLTKTSVEPSKCVDWEEVDDSNEKNSRRKLDFVIENSAVNEILKVREEKGCCSQPDVETEFRVDTRNLRPNECLKNSRNVMSIKVARRERSMRFTRKNDLFSFNNNLYELQFSEDFLFLASVIKRFKTNDKLVQELVELRHIELPEQLKYRDSDEGSPSCDSEFDDNAEDDKEDDEDDVSASQKYGLYIKALVDFSSKTMAGLHIDDVLNQLVLRNQNALVVSKENSDSSTKYTPKVEIDAESIRLSKLPLGNDEFNGDDDKAKYWEGERELYEGRLDEFISAMHLIQGDMHFSPWKGSVVDSVVGVFLTQNVSDRHSSEAIMTIASRFPVASGGASDSVFHDSDLLRISDCSFDESAAEQQLLIIEKDPSSCPSSHTTNQNGGSVNSFDTKSTSGKRKGKKGKNVDKKDWDELRLKYSTQKRRHDRNRDSTDWDALRQTSYGNLSKVIKGRGMNHLLSTKIKDFLQDLVTYHERIDLEWLRDVPPEEAKNFLLSIHGLGLKSVECVRLLSLHQQAFPVDVNISRVSTRLGWIPVKPLPNDLKFHLLEEYPVLDDVQTYLWPRVKNIPHAKLYEAHCHLILFGKSICTKKKPNCGACPFKASCRHYASECASDRPHLKGPRAEYMESHFSECASSQYVGETSRPMLPGLDGDLFANTGNSRNCEPVIEMPKSPRCERTKADADVLSQTVDIEDLGQVLSDDIEYTNSEDYMLTYDLCSKKESKALVIKNDTATFYTPPLFSKERLRTEHYVYELPDSHPLLAGFEKREPEDEFPYLLAIWMPDTKNSSHKSAEVVKYQDEKIVKGTILVRTNSTTLHNFKFTLETYISNDICVQIPCRTASRGSFPLNGTYFQKNEVFADHESSELPIDVLTDWIWNLKRRPLYCSTSVTSICKEMTGQRISTFFREASMCTRGFDRTTRAPKKLNEKLHKSFKKADKL